MAERMSDYAATARMNNLLELARASLKEAAEIANDYNMGFRFNAELPGYTSISGEFKSGWQSSSYDC